MDFDNGTFEFDIYCNICGSNHVEYKYDTMDNSIIVTCECGNKDILIINS